MEFGYLDGRDGELKSFKTVNKKKRYRERERWKKTQNKDKLMSSFFRFYGRLGKERSD
jgi:translation initiation factor 2 alpha subunit (eIF-2alpha)